MPEDQKEYIPATVETTLPQAVGKNTPADLLAIAVTQNADLEKLSKLMDLQERWEKNEARKKYIKAMAAFKANPPKIAKAIHVKYMTKKGEVEYKHADLAEAAMSIGMALSEHGLSAVWKTNQDKSQISVTCTITHVDGHSESTTISAGPDTSGGKNDLQAIGSTITYLQRYTLLTMTGLAAMGEDDDGQSSEPVEIISDDMQLTLATIASDAHVDEKKFCQYFGITSFDKLPLNRYGEAVAMIQKKLAQTEATKGADNADN